MASPSEPPATGAAVGSGVRASRRVGRPPKIDRAAIASAVGDLPPHGVTVRAVAEHLGVSVAALYHYVSGKEELELLAAEHSAARIPLPEDRGQHWAVWLYEWAEYARRAFVADPGLMAQFTDGGLGLDRMVDHIDTALGLCVRSGFTEQEALDAYFLISGFAVGAAIREIRTRAMAAAGTPLELQYRLLLAKREAAELPHLRSLVATGVEASLDFADEVATALAGIAVRRGERWKDVVGLIRGSQVECDVRRQTGDQV